MRNEQIEKFLDYLSRDPALQRDLTRRARTPEQFYANAARFARLFGYSFSADELKAWEKEFKGGDLLTLAKGNPLQDHPEETDSARPSSIPDSPHPGAGDNPLQAA